MAPKLTQNVEITGEMIVSGSTPGDGKVLTSDENGKATWEDPSGGGGGGIIIPLFAEEGGNLSASTSGGFQFSFGNGDVADGFGAIVGWSAEIIGVGISARSNSSGTGTIEVYKGGNGDSTSSATGATVSLTSGQRHAFVDYSSSPIALSAGDWVTFKTTANTGTINGIRVIAYVRITATIP